MAVYCFVPMPAWAQLLVHNGIAAVAVVLATTGAQRNLGGDPRPWRLTAVALGGFLLGEMLWWAFTVAGVDPYPSVADAVYLGSYLPLAAAAATLGRRTGEEDRSAWIDALIVALSCGVVVWAVLIDPYVGDASLSLLERAVTVAYPLADLLVLGFVIRLVLVRSGRTVASSVFVAGVLATLVADFSFGWLALEGRYADDLWVDVTWLVGYLLLGVAAHFDRPIVAMPTSARDLGRGRLGLVLVTILMPLGVVAVEVGGDGFDTVTVALLVTAAVAFLVAVRLWRLLGVVSRLEQRRAENRLAEVVNHSADAIVLTDAGLAITYASPAFSTFADRPAADCLGMSLETWLDNAGWGLASGSSLRRVFDVAPGTVVDLAVEAVQPDDAVLACEGTAVDLRHDPDVGAVVFTLRDVTARLAVERQLRERAFHDELTGLANRALLLDRVGHALARHTRHPDAAVALLFIDLDDFKAVNDGLGHAAGDELLRGVARRVRRCIRPGDTVARLGGDEFAVLIEDLGEREDALETARRLVEVLQLPLSVGGLELAAPASIGVAWAEPGATVETLLRDADIAMYRAKATGKGRVVEFDDSLQSVAAEVLRLRMELPRALERGQFRLVYQPIVTLADSRLTGVEALLRWDHPERGEVEPDDFIPLAEQTGAIVAIGRWVLETACREGVRWADGGSPIGINVNVSPVQLREPGFLADVESALASSTLSPDLLTVEITESVLVDPDVVGPVLEGLRDLGVGVSIDDFGIGYSSLSYLRNFPVTAVKIDRSFVNDLAAGDVGVVRSILALADSLALVTVAEGVETDDQLAELERLDCSLAQGYLLGGPRTRRASTASCTSWRDRRTLVGGRSVDPLPPRDGQMTEVASSTMVRPATPKRYQAKIDRSWRFKYPTSQRMAITVDTRAKAAPMRGSRTPNWSTRTSPSVASL